MGVGKHCGSLVLNVVNCYQYANSLEIRKLFLQFTVYEYVVRTVNRISIKDTRSQIIREKLVTTLAHRLEESLRVGIQGAIHAARFLEMWEKSGQTKDGGDIPPAFIN
jgi:hypothetical protein